MTFRKFLFEYTKFTLKSKLIYYGVNTSESFIFSLIIFKLILNMNDTDVLLIAGIATVLTPAGIIFAGGYDKIKQAFMKKHKLNEEDF
jgi:hypothetical protein